eukprot:CAMPEP_0117578360 /NCGR_PEP_ID=MMETSP0784-20121206/63961_1 /TAXON_ID=39447 /ORGANISM="" /LENGTH=46 /DNA_ID= /DNA_START= /DNA_END= /DNA_ORIENTATION=
MKHPTSLRSPLSYGLHRVDDKKCQPHASQGSRVDPPPGSSRICPPN